MVVNQTPANAEDRTELFYAVFLAQGGDKFQGLLASDISKAVVDSIGQRNSHVKTCSCGGLLNETNIYSKGKTSVFELWKNGKGFSEIANILGSKPGTIFTMLRDTGGIKPNERKRAVAHLTLSEREEIRAGLSAKMSIRAIATMLNRSPSTISREVQRNRGRRYYKAVDANNRANRMAKRPKPCLLDRICRCGACSGKAEMKWSPEQISGWLRRTKPRQKTLRIHLQFIRRFTFVVVKRYTT
jgi:DNA-binding CsgD family transcriptional regulator